MSNCGNSCPSKKAKQGPQDFIQATITEIQSAFKKEGPAINHCSDHDTYLYLLQNAPFYVSGVHCKDGKITWWAAAEDKEAYDKWEESIEHQHHPQEVHEHYLCNNPGLEV